jgi:hypothetical protein
VYKPAAQILDNWGWCNASTVSTVRSTASGAQVVIGAEENTTGRYSANLQEGNCDPSFPEAWSYFNGVIIVIPEDVLPGNR